MDNTIFFGNGINLVAGGKSWDDILKDMSFRDSLPAISSNTLKYEYIILQKPYKQFVPLLLKGRPLLLAGKIYGEFFYTEIGVVKRKLCDMLYKQSHSPYYTELFNINTQNYVTTNYELFLNKEFESHGFSHIKNSGNTSRLFVRDALSKHIQSVSIWNIHGNLKAPDSIMLGIKDYCEYVSEINQYINEDHSESVNTWIDLFFRTNVYIIGFGLGYEEIDLWYILTIRKRLKRQNNGIINNHIYYYDIERDSDKDKNELLKSLDIEVINVPYKDSYQISYEIMFGMLREKIGEREIETT